LSRWRRTESSNPSCHHPISGTLAYEPTSKRTATGRGRVLLGLLPILTLILVYLLVASARHAENPRDKITPIPSAMAAAVQTMALQADPRTGEVPMIADTRLACAGWELLLLWRR